MVEKIINAGAMNHSANQGVKARFETSFGRKRKITVPITPTMHPPLIQYGNLFSLILFYHLV